MANRIAALVLSEVLSEVNTFNPLYFLYESEDNTLYG